MRRRFILGTLPSSITSRAAGTRGARSHSGWSDGERVACQGIRGHTTVVWLTVKRDTQVTFLSVWYGIIADMTEHRSFYLEKALESLDGAASEYTSRRYNNCANRAYHASFQAAVYALEQSGVHYQGTDATWAHRTLQATFAQELIGRRKVYAAELRSVLPLNYQLRQSADYSRHWVTETQARRALDRTRAFLAAIRRRGGGQ